MRNYKNGFFFLETDVGHKLNSEINGFHEQSTAFSGLFNKNFAFPFYIKSLFMAPASSLLKLTTAIDIQGISNLVDTRR